MKQVIVVSLVALSLVLVGCSTSPSEDLSLSTFATCLTDNGAKMYGAYWCPHCKDQKAMFGDAWEDVNYIECSLPGGSGQTAVCQQAGITGYPTWEYGDGNRVAGAQPLAELARVTGCQLPQ